MTKLGPKIAGPAAPAEQLDKLDAEQAAIHANWSTMRDAVVAIGKRSGILKADPGMTAPATGPGDDVGSIHDDYVDDVVAPPYDFEVLCNLYENSGALRQNIDAMVTNVDGFGHTFEPVLKFNGPNINDQVRDLMVLKRINDSQEVPDDLLTLGPAGVAAIQPSIEEVEETKTFWSQVATIEHGVVKSFFDFVNPLEPFTELRQATRETLELLGNAGWEVIREDPMDVTSRISQVYHVPFIQMRLVRTDRSPIEVDMKIRKDPIHFESVTVERFFRRYVKVSGSSRVYYKEMGDPRVVSRNTGRYYETVEEMRANEDESARPANEFFHWSIRSPASPYGIPRWVSALLSVLGSRAAEEVNFLYFDNKAIPPMVLLVSGGRVTEDSVARIESYIEDRVKGRENFHKIMILEGLPADSDVSGEIEHSGRMRVELKPLVNQLPQDALFQDYDKNNVIKVGRAFRQPPILTGDTRDMNRSTAQVAKAFAEEQVYQPARDHFDALMDRHFMTNLNVHFWRFRTRAPVQRIPNDLVDNVTKSLDKGAITPNEGRVLLADAFSIDLDYVNEDWANVPPALAQAAARQGALPSVEPVASQDEGEEDESLTLDDDGDLVSRGKSSEVEGHHHSYVAVKHAGGVVVYTMPAQGHSHDPVSLDYREGKVVTKSIGSDGQDHEHVVQFAIPVSKKTRQMRGFLGFLHEVRQHVSDEVEKAKDQFFDPSAWPVDDEE